MPKKNNPGCNCCVPPTCQRCNDFDTTTVYEADILLSGFSDGCLNDTFTLTPVARCGWRYIFPDTTCCGVNLFELRLYQDGAGNVIAEATLRRVIPATFTSPATSCPLVLWEATFAEESTEGDFSQIDCGLNLSNFGSPTIYSTTVDCPGFTDFGCTYDTPTSIQVTFNAV